MIYRPQVSFAAALLLVMLAPALAQFPASGMAPGSPAPTPALSTTPAANTPAGSQVYEVDLKYL